MATSDLLLIDSSAAPQQFTPESTDQGTSAASGKTIKRSMVGMYDGAQVTFGSIGDVPISGDTPATAGNSYMRSFRGMWRDLNANLTALGTAIAATLTTSEVAPIPVVVSGSTAFVSAKATAGKFLHLQVVNNSTSPMYAVIEDTASTSAPAASATLSPVRVIEVPASDNTTANAGIVDHAVPLRFVNGCRVTLTTSYLTYTAVTGFTGLISVSAI